MNKECLCLNCIYGGQPYGYFPIVCVHGKRVKEMWHEVFRCKHFERCPEPPELKLPEVPKQKPWQVIINERI